MRIYKEAEAVGYLERLNKTITDYDFNKAPPFSNFKAALSIELSYFQRLMRDPAKKELAVLGIASNGFPELPSLMIDVQNAYKELDVIESEVGKSVYPLFQQLNVTDNLADFDEGVTKVMANFEKDQEHINLLKERPHAQELVIRKYIPDPLNTDNYSRQTDYWGASIYTKKEGDSLLHYDRGVKITDRNLSNLFRQMGNRNINEWQYVTGSLKYIDLINSDPILVDCYGLVTSDRQKTVIDTRSIYIFPNTTKFSALLQPLNQTAREMILSVDCTNFSDEEFHHFVESVSRMGTLLKYVEIKPENLQTESTPTLPEGWRRFLKS